MDNYKKDKSYIKQRLEYVSPVDYISELEEQIENLQQEKDKFKLRCFKALKLIRDNYGVLDKYGIDLLDDILNGDEDDMDK